LSPLILTTWNEPRFLLFYWRWRIENLKRMRNFHRGRQNRICPFSAMIIRMIIRETKCLSLLSQTCDTTTHFNKKNYIPFWWKNSHSNNMLQMFLNIQVSYEIDNWYILCYQDRTQQLEDLNTGNLTP